MPWSPTQSFPHPLAITHPEDCKETVANFISYAIVDMMVWEGLGDIVNTFRKDSLSLDSLDGIIAPSIIHRLQVPCAYLWYDNVPCLPTVINRGTGLLHYLINLETGLKISTFVDSASFHQIQTTRHQMN